MFGATYHRTTRTIQIWSINGEATAIQRVSSSCGCASLNVLNRTITDESPGEISFTVSQNPAYSPPSRDVSIVVSLICGRSLVMKSRVRAYSPLEFASESNTGTSRALAEQVMVQADESGYFQQPISVNFISSESSPPAPRILSIQPDSLAIHFGELGVDQVLLSDDDSKLTLFQRQFEMIITGVLPSKQARLQVEVSIEPAPGVEQRLELVLKRQSAISVAPSTVVLKPNRMRCIVEVMATDGAVLPRIGNVVFDHSFGLRVEPCHELATSTSLVYRIETDGIDTNDSRIRQSTIEFLTVEGDAAVLRVVFLGFENGR